MLAVTAPESWQLCCWWHALDLPGSSSSARVLGKYIEEAWEDSRAQVARPLAFEIKERHSCPRSSSGPDAQLSSGQPKATAFSDCFCGSIWRNDRLRSSRVLEHSAASGKETERLISKFSARIHEEMHLGHAPDQYPIPDFASIVRMTCVIKDIEVIIPRALLLTHATMWSGTLMLEIASTNRFSCRGDLARYPAGCSTRGVKQPPLSHVS